MPNPKVLNHDVRAMIRVMTVGAVLPSGAAVRAALATRFGSRGGVARIYRLLAEEGARLAPAPEAGSLESLQQEVRVLRETLARTEAREDAHQTYWAEQVDRLRQKVQMLEPLAQEAQIAGDVHKLLRHQLQAAELRAARLEEKVLALESGAGQGGSTDTEYRYKQRQTPA